MSRKSREDDWCQSCLEHFQCWRWCLAAVGLYSVVSYSVVQRTNEFGIRMAVGARKKDVLWNVAASAGVSVGSGLLAGLVLSLGLNKVISRWVENSAHDPWLIVGVLRRAAGCGWIGMPASVVERRLRSTP